MKRRPPAKEGEAVTYKEIDQKAPDDWPNGMSFPPGGKLRYPVWTIASPEEYKLASENLKAFAEKGIIIGFAKEYWEASLYSRGRAARDQRRNAFKHFNAHNDKLGVDYDNVGK